MPKPSTPDFDAMLATVSQVGGPTLRVDVVLDALPADQAAKVRAALDNPLISAARIAKALTKMGPDYAASEGAVASWRRRYDNA